MVNNFNFSVLSKFGSVMYETLLYKHHLTHETAKLVEFKTEEYKPMQGYIFTKDNKKYIIDMLDDKDKDNLNKFPIRVTETEIRDMKNGDVVHKINQYRSFKITPEQHYSFQDMITMDNNVHSLPDEYTLYKIIAWAARFGRIAVRISACPGWGKTSYYATINHLYDKTYVITRPRTVAGIAKGITQDGVMVLDEMGHLPKEIRDEVSSMLYQLGQFFTSLTLGSAGSVAHKTKPLYNVDSLSCVVLYNRIEDYKDKDDFFDFMFSNAAALNDRFLPLRLPDGKLDGSQFKDDQIKDLSEETKTMFINFIKSAEYYKQNWFKIVDDKHVSSSLEKYKDVKDRHMKSINCIASFIYLFSYDEQRETLNTGIYDYYLDMLYQWYKDYNDVVEDKRDSDDLFAEEIKMK